MKQKNNITKINHFNQAYKMKARFKDLVDDMKYTVHTVRAHNDKRKTNVLPEA